METSNNGLYRQLPSVGEVLERVDVGRFLETYSRAFVTEAVREVLERLRRRVRSGELDEAGLSASLQDVGTLVSVELNRRSRPSLRRVINATGVVLQTNLGRAPLADAALDRVLDVARGYCNLEFDLETGERSRRDVHAEELLLQALHESVHAAQASAPTRAAAVVNNCAAATFLALNTLAEGGEVIVSRGELVEIGGGFRIPEILQKSGAILREVGTTNKTRVADYAAALGPATRLILRVHRSNFRIEGFTEQPAIEELIELGRQSGVPVFDDQGTGCLVAMEQLGLIGESSWAGSVASGASLVAASGDKLLGGPQCGILVGEHAIVERIRANPLFRALRVDKLTYAALQGTLLLYVTGRSDAVPAIAMMRMPAEKIRQRCQRWSKALQSERVTTAVVEVRSVIGGGTTPGASLPSFAVALQDKELTEGDLAARLRGLDPAIVGRVSEGRLLLDLRTVDEAEDEMLLLTLRHALAADTSDSKQSTVTWEAS